MLVRRVGAGVPDDDGPRAVLAFRDHAFVARVAHGVVLGHDGEAFVRGVEGRAFGNRERLEDAVDLKADVVVQAAGVVLLDDEDQPPVAGRPRFGRRLGGEFEVALLFVVFEHVSIIPTSNGEGRELQKWVG